MSAAAEHPAETAVAVLDVSVHFDGAGHRNWPMQVLTWAFRECAVVCLRPNGIRHV
jgi:hypothetical protein